MASTLTKAGPVNSEQFLARLLRVCPLSPWRRQHHIGLAISGGVDSMALAALCSALQAQPLPGPAGRPLNFRFSAFIVDHGVRSGSAAEATRVSSALQTMGIAASVLKLQWPPDVDPRTRSNFETLARRLRYQALGKACRDNSIHSLLVAHHADDQVETVIMRMLGKQRGKGLKGISAAANLPECEGIYGIDQSGLVDALSRRASIARPGTRHPQWPMFAEAGGVKMYRPLLDVHKADLEATCATLKVPFFEDATNHDQTLTLRNAVRHVYKHHRLPQALGKPAILDLARRIRAKQEAIAARADELFSQLLVHTFFAGSGVVTVDFGTVDEHEPHRRDVIWSLLERCMELVTPRREVGLRDNRLALHVFPDLSTVQVVKEVPTPVTFPIRGVMFQPVDVQHEEHDGLVVRHRNVWMLSRQPPMSNERREITSVFPPARAPDAPGFSAWQLFDGRYWIRIKNKTSHTMTLRLLDKDDLHVAKTMVCLHQRRKKGREMLRRMAPGTIRCTLPGLFQTTTDGHEVLIAVPTLNLADVRHEGDVEFEVRYQHLDLGAHGPALHAAIRLPGVSQQSGRAPRLNNRP